jgi:hypothetical protein
MTERRYNDEEVALILREASQVQEGEGRGEGLSLAQLKQIATEVGLDPAAVEAAARRLAKRRPAVRSLLFDTPVAPEFDEEIPGELEQKDMTEVVTVIRRALGRRGVSEADLGALEWSARDAMGGRYVSVLPKDGTTRVRVFGNFRDGLMLVGLGAGIPLTITFTAMLGRLGVGEFLGPAILLLGALLSVLPVRVLWRWRYRREEEGLAALAEALDARIRELLAEKRSAPPEIGPGDPP